MFFCKHTALWVCSHRCSTEIFLKFCLFCGIRIPVFVVRMFQSRRETHAFLASQAAPINHTVSTYYSATVAIYHQGQLSALILWGWETAVDFCYYLLPEKYNNQEPNYPWVTIKYKLKLLLHPNTSLNSMKSSF